MKYSLIFIAIGFLGSSALAEEGVKIWPEKTECSARIDYVDLVNDEPVEEVLDAFAELKLETEDSIFPSSQITLKSKRSNLVFEIRPSFQNRDYHGNPAKSKQGIMQVTALFGEEVFTSLTQIATAPHTKTSMQVGISLRNPKVEQVVRSFYDLPEKERKGRGLMEVYKQSFQGQKLIMTYAYVNCSFFSFDTKPIKPGI